MARRLLYILAWETTGFPNGRKKRIGKMEKVTSVNSFIGSLPRLRGRRIWHVIIDGKIVQGVSAKDNRKSSAEAYIASKYPGQVFTLKFHEWRLGAPR